MVRGSSRGEAGQHPLRPALRPAPADEPRGSDGHTGTARWPRAPGAERAPRAGGWRLPLGLITNGGFVSGRSREWQTTP